MTDSRAQAEAEGDLVRLNAQVTAMRAVLVQLLQEVVRADSRLDHDQAAALLEANERLVVSAMGALSDAETASGALDEAARVGALDPLTGLPNRTRLMDRFERDIASAKRHGNRVALLFLDLDDFKQINDTFGHAAGDRALQLVADCLRSLVRETDMVSRHGGDEFLIVLAEVVEASDAAVVAEKVNAALQAFSRIENRVVRLSASIGISIYPEDGNDPKTLIDRADAAMYIAKKRAAGGFAFHNNPRRGPASLPALSVDSGPELATAERERRHENLREANEKLLLAALGAQDLLSVAEEVKRRQSALLAMIAKELSDPYAPIRLAAATLGIPAVEATLLPRIHALIDEQADRISRRVAQVLDQQHVEPAPGLGGS